MPGETAGSAGGNTNKECTILSISIAFFRIFGLAWGSLFDGLLGVVRRVMAVAGLTSYWQAMQVVKKLRWQAPAQTGEAYHA
jgi:hypothetical protein